MVDKDFQVDWLGVRTYWEWDCTVMDLPYGDYYRVKLGAFSLLFLFRLDDALSVLVGPIQEAAVRCLFAKEERFCQCLTRSSALRSWLHARRTKLPPFPHDSMTFSSSPG